MMRAELKSLFHFSSILLLVAAVSFGYWKLYGEPLIGIDDANIYFVYAQNIAAGHGFVFNPGAERVEGFTSLLWTLITTVFYALSDHFELMLLMLNIFIVSITLFKSIQLINKLIPWPFFFSPAAILFLSLMLLIPGYVEWGILSLMETGLWSMLMVWMATQLLHYILSDRICYPFFHTALFLLLITRPESIFWGLFYVLALLLIHFIKGRTSLQQNRNVMVAFGVYAATIGALTVFRLWYFGYPLPNTFYAKVSGNFFHNVSAGLAYFLKSCVQTPTLWLVIFLSILSIALIVIQLKRSSLELKHLNKLDIVQALTAVLSLMSIVIPVLLGGDHFLFGRFFQPYFPVYYLLFFNIYFYGSHLLPAYPLKNQHIIVPAYLLTLLLLPYIYLNSNTHLLSFRKSDSPLKIEFEIAELGRENGKKLNILFKRIELPTVGISEAGGFGFTYQGISLDLLGLNATLVAHATDKRLTGIKNHSAFSQNAFYELQPDIFFAHSQTSFFVENIENLQKEEEEHDGTFAIGVYRNIFAEPDFRQLYKRVLIRDPESRLNLLTYCHKDFITLLLQHHYDIMYLQNIQLTESMNGQSGLHTSGKEEQLK